MIYIFNYLFEKLDYTERFNKKAFVGRLAYELQHIRVVNKEKPEQWIELNRAVPQLGGFNSINFDFDKQEINHWHIFIGSYRTALVTPFSEVIPLTTIKTGGQYAKETGNFKASRIADETITEGLSHVLALELAEKLDVPDGVRFIHDFKKRLDHPLYKHLPEAIVWIKKNGAQNALDLYMEDLEKFMEAVKR